MLKQLKKYLANDLWVGKREDAAPIQENWFLMKVVFYMTVTLIVMTYPIGSTKKKRNS